MCTKVAHFATFHDTAMLMFFPVLPFVLPGQEKPPSPVGKRLNILPEWSRANS